MSSFGQDLEQGCKLKLPAESKYVEVSENSLFPRKKNLDIDILLSPEYR